MPNPWAQQTTPAVPDDALAIGEALGMTYLGGIGALRDMVNNLQAASGDSDASESDATPEDEVYVPHPT